MHANIWHWRLTIIATLKRVKEIRVLCLTCLKPLNHKVHILLANEGSFVPMHIIEVPFCEGHCVNWVDGPTFDSDEVRNNYQHFVGISCFTARYRFFVGIASSWLHGSTNIFTSHFSIFSILAYSYHCLTSTSNNARHTLLTLLVIRSPQSDIRVTFFATQKMM